MAQASIATDASSAPASARGWRYAACVRTHALDVAATLFLFIGASIAAGRVWRFPFDDEIYTLSLIERHSALTLLTVFPRREDVTPPLPYLLFYGLHQLGLTEGAMRLCSLVLTALALVLLQLLALTLMAERNRAPSGPATRLIAVIVFALTPLAIGRGDALRWYPLFALLIAVFVTLYLVPRDGVARLCSGAVLGLAGSTSLLAALVALALMAYRYGLERRFRWSFDVSYWLLAAAGASLGVYSAVWTFATRSALAHTEFDPSILRSVLTDALGFFGGDALGVGQAWMVAPAIIVFAIAAFSQIDRQQPGNPAHLLLLMLGATASMALLGFSKPRSFLFLAPIVAALLTLFFDWQMRQGKGMRVLALLTLTLATSVAAIANVNFGTHPFKRNSVIPYQQILDFIDANAKGAALVVSTDPVIPWLMRASPEERCAGYFFAAARCLNSGRRYDSVFVIFGHSDQSANAAVMRKFDEFVAGVTAGRRKVATLPAGLDEDAALKSRLTGVPLSKYILTVDLYE